MSALRPTPREKRLEAENAHLRRERDEALRNVDLFKQAHEAAEKRIVELRERLDALSGALQAFTEGEHKP